MLNVKVDPYMVNRTLIRSKSLIVKKCPINQYYKNHQQAVKQTTSIISNKTAEILYNSPGMVSWKNVNSVFLGCNQKLAQLGNLKSPDAIIGKRDCDLPWGASGYSDILKEQDKEVLSGIIMYVLGKYQFADKERLVLVKKIPILNDSECIVGIINYFTEFYRESFIDIMLAFNDLGIETSHMLINRIKSIFFEKQFQLSQREEECAYFLLQGLSAKEMGKLLGLSYRTVESYLTSLKEKLQCNKTSTLIVKLIELGYLDNSLVSQ